MNIVLVGARERSDNPKDKEAVEGIIKKLSGTFGRRLYIVSVGCDRGIGKIARDYCVESGIIFVENRMKLEGKDISRSFFVHVFQARNPALVALGDEFHVFKGPNENGIVEGIIDLAVLKVSAQRVWVYESNNLVPSHPTAPQTLEEMAGDAAKRIAELVEVGWPGPVPSGMAYGLEQIALQEINKMIDVWKSVSWLR